MIKGLFGRKPSFTHLSSLISVTKIGTTMKIPGKTGQHQKLLTQFASLKNEIFISYCENFRIIPTTFFF